MRPYIKDPSAIYAASFATVRSEARLQRFPAGLATLAIRLIHACGMVDVADRLAFSTSAFEQGQAALRSGAPILCDCEMVRAGIIRRHLPADNDIVVTLNDLNVPDMARDLGTTRSAAAVDLWADRLGGAVVAIGNAPTALFRLLEVLDAGAPRPAVILGFPVGFVGAAESKAELAHDPRGCEFIFEGEVGAVQESHHHHVEGQGASAPGSNVTDCTLCDTFCTGLCRLMSQEDHHHDHHHHDHDHHHHADYPHADHPHGPESARRTKA